MRRYIHAKIGEEIRAIGGAYTVLREERFPWRGREVLVVIGAARFDTSCCGVGGCGYAQAQGYVVEDLRTENALLVEPIAPPDREELAVAIKQRTHVLQVQFRED
ncbi:MAG TPA: hypothetical protein PKW95_21990 [bacterium]|nr:hypothetical protein [bacterium]